MSAKNNIGVKIRRSQDRGRTQVGWLDSYHSFSFGEYVDPEQMSFRTLRVINEDWINPGMGFGAHPHRDMEIITYVVSGALQHKDSLGTGSVIKPGDLQKMSAGTGIVHSEFNASDDVKVHLLQIWIVPSKKGIEPGYQQIAINSLSSTGLTLVASKSKQKGIIHVEQDVELFLGKLKPGQSVAYDCGIGRGLWIQVIKGIVEGEGWTAKSGDGLSCEQAGLLKFAAKENAEFLLFDLK